MIQLFTELQEKKNVRSNLSALRASLKEATEEQKAQAIEFVRGHEDLVFGFLQEEDAKTRKNAALLLGDLAVQNALQPLWKVYTREQTLFVKSAYLEAMKALHAEEILSQLKDRLAELEGEPSVRNVFFSLGKHRNTGRSGNCPSVRGILWQQADKKKTSVPAEKLKASCQVSPGKFSCLLPDGGFLQSVYPSKRVHSSMPGFRFPCQDPFADVRLPTHTVILKPGGNRLR